MIPQKIFIRGMETCNKRNDPVHRWQLSSVPGIKELLWKELNCLLVAIVFLAAATSNWIILCSCILFKFSLNLMLLLEINYLIL